MIPIQNIYYMLSYAFQILRENGYKNLSSEDFNNTAELYAAILSKGVSIQLKRGLSKGYTEKSEPLSMLRGRVEFSESIRTSVFLKKKLVCAYDDFSDNIYINRILKTTMEFLLRNDISEPRKNKLKKLLLFFADVENLNIHNINWNVHYNKNNQNYRLLINICELAVEELLPFDSEGNKRLINFEDNRNFPRLYEKFILEYYKQTFRNVSVSSSQIPWAVDCDETIPLLPIMQSDVMLKYNNKLLIIDAKYYSKIVQMKYNTIKIHSQNLYQIFTYVKNKAYRCPYEVSGMLLYAKTDQNIQPDCEFSVEGNKIIVRTLDLNRKFSEIAFQLNSIADEYLGCAACSLN